MAYPLDPKEELFVWGPITLKSFYNDWGDGLFVLFGTLYPGYQWPDALCMYKDGFFVYLSGSKEMAEGGRRAFVDLILNEKKRSEVRKDWDTASRELRRIEDEIDAADLSTLSNDGLRSLWTRFHRIIGYFWAYGSVPEYANYGSVGLLQEKLRRSIPIGDLASAMEILTAPEDFSFYQREEIELAEASDVILHQSKYFWINNSYDHIEILPVSYFEKRKRELTSKLRIKAEERIAFVRKKKDELRKRYGLSEKAMTIANGITHCITWQDERKEKIWTYLHYKDALLNETVRRFGYKKELLLHLLSSEVTDILFGTTDAKEYEWKLNGNGILYKDGKVEILKTVPVLSYWDLYLKTDVSNASEFTGIIASRGNGTVRGTVRIVHDPRNPGTFEQGDILVTSMTSPEFVFLMKKAGAVVTDTGGLMSHAAVVSREFNVPCIVGTKVATKILKDGDVVEVDAENGIVSIVSPITVKAEKPLE